eukprot:12528712-Ditylum_brightwellii.AAC.1
MENELDIYSKQKGRYSTMHPSIPNPNNTTKLFPILKLTQHQLHQSQFLFNLEYIKLSGDSFLKSETT